LRPRSYFVENAVISVTLDRMTRPTLRFWLCGLLAFGLSLASAHAQRLLEDLDSVLQRYVEASGGQKSMDAINALRVIGTFQMGEDDYDLVLIKRRPNLKIITYSRDKVKVTLGYDGETVWRQVDTAQGRKTERVTGEEAQEFIDGIDFDGPLIGKMRPGETRKLLEPERIGRVDYYRIEQTHGDKRTVFYIDSRTMREAKNIEYTTNEAGETEEQVTFLSNYGQVSGIWLPHKIETVKGGQRKSLMEVEEVEANPGIVRSFFSMPSAPAPLPKPEANENSQH